MSNDLKHKRQNENEFWFSQSVNQSANERTSRSSNNRKKKCTTANHTDAHTRQREGKAKRHRKIQIWWSRVTACTHKNESEIQRWKKCFSVYVTISLLFFDEHTTRTGPTFKWKRKKNKKIYNTQSYVQLISALFLLSVDCTTSLSLSQTHINIDIYI